MRVALLFPLYICLTAATLSAGVIDYSTTQVSPNQIHYDYSLANVPVLANQEIDIRFDPTIFGTISNATAGPGFFLVGCCQPNNPPGAFGDYIIVALTDMPSPSGKFGVDVVVFGSSLPGSSTPGSQPFFVNQLDSDGNLLYNLSAGFSVSDAPTNTPEPATFGLIALVLMAATLSWGANRVLNIRGKRK